MDCRLQEAAIKGDVAAIRRLLDEAPLLLDAPTVPTDSPLHVAALLGHGDLAGEIIRRRPGLARSPDGRGSYPLHIAAAKGHVEITKSLMEADPSVARRRNREGQTPLHLAAANGRVELLSELLPAGESFGLAVTARGETVLHLSVKYGQVEVAKFLLEDHKELINFRDERGFTALHIAMGRRHYEITNLLLQEREVEVNALNENGFTPLDILLQYSSESSEMEICDLLLRSGGQKGLHYPPIKHQNAPKPRKNSWVTSRFMLTDWSKLRRENDNWSNDMQNTIMIVSTVIAAATFQSGLNPPGNGASSREGNDDDYFIYFVIFDTVALGLSMAIILFLVSGVSPRNRLMTWVLIIVLWASVSSMALAFIMGANLLSKSHKLVTLLALVLLCWILLMIFLISYHFVVLFIQFLRRLCCCRIHGEEADLV